MCIYQMSYNFIADYIGIISYHSHLNNTDTQTERNKCIVSMIERDGEEGVERKGEGVGDREWRGRGTEREWRGREGGRERKRGRKGEEEREEGKEHYHHLTFC